jgi:hemin uptake protein HemP
MPTKPSDGEPTVAAPARSAAPRHKTVTVGELMGSARELIILHAEEQYRLRITSNGKLILTK